MNKTQAIKAIKALPGMTARSTFSTSGDADEIRVNFKGGAEATAYYTNDADDAVGTARLMARVPSSYNVTITALHMAPAAYDSLIQAGVAKIGGHVEYVGNDRYTYNDILAQSAQEAGEKAVAFHYRQHGASNRPFSVTNVGLTAAVEYHAKEDAKRAANIGDVVKFHGAATAVKEERAALAILQEVSAWMGRTSPEVPVALSEKISAALGSKTVKLTGIMVSGSTCDLSGHPNPEY